MGKRTCSVESCPKPHMARGWCGTHYQNWRRCGDPLGMRLERATGCSFPGCDNPFDSRGHCTGHAAQLRKGQELRPLRPLYLGASCTVGTCDEPIVARGYCHKHWRAWRKHGDPLIKLPPAREGSRKYALNAAYFDEVTTEAQAYWLGFITADGGIIQSGKTFALRVELAAYDEDHVRLLAAALGSDKPLQPRPGLIGASFDSWRLVESLGRLGVGPRKSATVEPWDGPASLMPHYWRGLFDGDGSIYKVGARTDWCLNICGSHACVEAFATWAKGISGGTATPRQVRDTACWTWTVTGTRKPQFLAEALYANATVALERKRDLAGQLRSLDLAELKAESDQRRSAAMRAAWRNGTHPRSTAPLT